MDCSLPGSSVDGISQASILDWVAISFTLKQSLCPGLNFSFLIISFFSSPCPPPLPSPQLSSFFSTYFEVYLTYNQLLIFKAFNLVSFDICIDLWNHHHNQKTEHFYHPPKFPGGLCRPPSLWPCPNTSCRLPLVCIYFWSCFFL